MRSDPIRAMLALTLAAAVACTACDVLKDPVPTGKPPETVGVDPTGEHLDTSTVMPADNGEQPLVASDAAAVAQAAPQEAAPPSQPAPQPKPQPAPQPSAPDQNATANTNSGPPPSQLPHTGGSAGVTHHTRVHGGGSSGN